MVGLSLLRLVSVTLAFVLSGTPAVAAACAALCTPADAIGQGGHHASAPAAHHAPEAAPESPAEHGQHHHAPDTATAVAANAEPPPPVAVVASVRDCCDGPGGVTFAPARVQTRADVASPLVAASEIRTDACVFRASPAHDPPVSPPPPPAPVRSPLILRI